MQQGQKTVLIIDDDEGIRDALEAALGLEDYQVLAVASGEQALSLLHEHAFLLTLLGCYPDLCILDHVMYDGGMDGKQVLPLIPHRDITRVLYLAATRTYVEQAVAWGADAAMGKPFDLDTLLDTVATLLGTMTPPTLEAVR